jgi:heme-degrading monooxygenase HmoA
MRENGPDIRVPFIVILKPGNHGKLRIENRNIASPTRVSSPPTRVDIFLCFGINFQTLWLPLRIKTGDRSLDMEIMTNIEYKIKQNPAHQFMTVSGEEFKRAFL